MARDLDYEGAADERYRSRRLRTLLVIIGTVAALTVAALWLRTSWVPFTGNESLSRAEVERIGQFRFPPGATDVLSNCVGLQDPILRVRFKLPSRELDQFVRSTGLALPLSSTSIPDDIARPGPPPPWWKPGQPTVFQAGESATPPPGPRGVHKAALIDESDSQTFTVWLVAYRPI
jgi:hypothetical protein